MINNYIKIAWRNLTQHTSYTVINIFGLAVAMACCILIALYAKEELSFDDFHKNADRIVSVGLESGFFGRTLSTPHPLADAMEEEMPAVEKAIRLNGTGPLKLSKDGQNFAEIETGKYTETAFFDIFSFDLIRGNPAKALGSPHSIILTEQVSRQLFTSSENPLGQSLYWQRGDTVEALEVTGIVEAPPQNSSIRYQAIVSYNTLDTMRRQPDAWRSYSLNTYALLSSKESLSSLPGQFEKLVRAHYKTREGEEPGMTFFGVPLTGLHLSEMSSDVGFTGNRSYLYLFGSVALFILIIACVNYVNLATARTSLRSQEVGVRKTLGAMRGQIVGQFLGESVFLAVISYLFGFVISLMALPYFNELFGTNVVWTNNYLFLGSLLLTAVVIGILAGFYPAIYLSGFSPAKVLRSKGVLGPAGSWLRKTLVVTQFAIAMALIISALVVYQQLNFTQTKDLGFNGEQVVSVEMPNYQGWRLRDQIRSTLLKQSGIQEVSVASSVPSGFNVRLGQKPEKISPRAQANTDESIVFSPAVVDYNYIDLLDIELLAGRNFSSDLATDKTRGYIINKKGAAKLGWTPEEAIGKPFGIQDSEGEIIGVTENFHISSLKEEIGAVVLQMKEASSWSSRGNILARLAPGQIQESMNVIEEELEKYDANMTFHYDFLDDKFDAMYRTERRLAKVVSLFTFIAIVIACLGLYGLSAFSVERRVKEVGIRKVLGATATQVVRLLSVDFLKLVLLGFLISIPIAWYAMNQWLQDFAYRIEIGPGIFVLAGAAAMVIALATVSWQSVRAAVANPVKSLRSE